MMMKIIAWLGTEKRACHWQQGRVIHVGVGGHTGLILAGFLDWPCQHRRRPGWVEVELRVDRSQDSRWDGGLGEGLRGVQYPFRVVGRP